MSVRRPPVRRRGEGAADTIPWPRQRGRCPEAGKIQRYGANTLMLDPAASTPNSNAQPWTQCQKPGPTARASCQRQTAWDAKCRVSCMGGTGPRPDSSDIPLPEPPKGTTVRHRDWTEVLALAGSLAAKSSYAGSTGISICYDWYYQTTSGSTFCFPHPRGPDGIAHRPS